MRVWCLVFVALVSCQAAAPEVLDEPLPRLEAPEVAVPVAATPGQHHLAFEVAIESSCSQSWDLTTHTGELTLSLTPDKTARLEMVVFHHSIGPGYDSHRFEGGDAPSRCVWEGSQSADGASRHLALSLVEPSDLKDAHYTCDIHDYERDAVLSDFTMRCDPLESEPHTITCTMGEHRPWLVHVMVEKHPLKLGLKGVAELSISTGDGLIEGELIRPEAL